MLVVSVKGGNIEWAIKDYKKRVQSIKQIEELRESIEFQTEIHNPCDESYFADGDEYADFCINEALCFFYNDDSCNDDDYYEDEDYDNENENEDDQSDREEVTKLMYDEFYDYLVGLWEDCD
jgi:hypothetical protein